MNTVIDQHHVWEYPTLSSVESAASDIKLKQAYAPLYGNEPNQSEKIPQTEIQDVKIDLGVSNNEMEMQQGVEEKQQADLVSSISIEENANQPSQLLTDIVRELKHKIEAQETVFYDYAIEILKKLAIKFFKTEISNNAVHFSKLIQELKSKLSTHDKPIIIYVNQPMFDKIQSFFVQVDCQLKIDAELENGNFYIKTPFSFIDGRIDKAIEELFLRTE